MSLETQAILHGHVSATRLSEYLVGIGGIKNMKLRTTHNPNYVIIEFMDKFNSITCINVFLNSYSADDYPEIYERESTFLSIEFSPTNFELLKSIVSRTGGFLKRINGESWNPA